MSFSDKSVILEVFSPNLRSPITTAEKAVVGAGEEFSDVAQFDIPNDRFSTVNVDFDIGASTIVYTIDDSGFGRFSSVPDFNGYVLTFDLQGDAIENVSVVRDALDLPEANIFFNANSIFMDVDGIRFSRGEQVELDVSFLDNSESLIDFDDAVFTARLYSAAFGRDPDQAGLNFWINTFDDVGRLGMSTFFLDSPEFQSRFGDPVALSNDGYLNVLYNNILGRNGDDAGTAFWLDALTRDVVSRAEVLSYFVDSEENVSNTKDFENLGVSAESGEWFLLT